MLVFASALLQLSAANRCGYKKSTINKGCAFARVVTDEEARTAKSLTANQRCDHSLGSSVGPTVRDMRHALTRALRPHSNAEGRSPDYEQHHWSSLPRDLGLQQPQTICEIGLNTGHSALFWLCSFPHAQYHSFDIMRFNVSLRAADFLRRAFPGRFELTAGDTKVTLKAHVSSSYVQCDVMSIDGDHTLAGASSDLSQMRALARRGKRSIVIMDDLRCGAWWCGPPTAAWHSANASGIVRQAGCEIMGCCTGWCWGEYG